MTTALDLPNTPAIGWVVEASAERHEANENYLKALSNAYESGHDYAAIARAAGTTRQNIRQLLLRKADQ